MTATAQDHAAPYRQPDRILAEKRNDVLELMWMDTEDRLQGGLTPDTPREGVPLKVTLHVGSFDGAAFEGPITLTLREAGARHGQTVTVRREKGAVNWLAEFTPETTGPHQLDVSFRTTRLKALHADIEVASRPVPRIVLWAIVGVAGIVAVGYGIRSLVRKDTSSDPHPVLAELAAMPPAAPASAPALAPALAPEPATTSDTPPAPAPVPEPAPAAAMSPAPEPAPAAAMPPAPEPAPAAAMPPAPEPAPAAAMPPAPEPAPSSASATPDPASPASAPVDAVAAATPEKPSTL